MAAAPACIAFEGYKSFAQGARAEVALALKRRAARSNGPFFVFDYASGKPITLDYSGDDAVIERRFAARAAPAEEAPRGPGRPKLGVVAREVTLLPRHWEWLSAQPGGASVALRKLVDEARKVRGPRDAKRASQESAFHFMTAIAGNLPNYEDATRALFAGDGAQFTKLTAKWPQDVREHALRYAAAALNASE